jgi:mycobactin lysine-N-oxygenase
MTSSPPRSLIVIGAGPKAISLVAKNHVLAQLGLSVPSITVVDRQGVASAWSGESGFTDGTPLLGTLAEKDIGFPYDSSAWGKLNLAVNEAMTAYSWQQYLISTGAYSAWIDRGRPQPSHRIWASYLRWVAARIGLEVMLDEIREIRIRDSRWVLSCVDHGDGSRHDVSGDALVVTGAGAPVRISGQPAEHGRVMDGNTFWTRSRRFTHLKHPVSVAVIGTGETAAAIVVALAEGLHRSSSIEIISSGGVPYSRGESYEESRLFSNPGEEWERLTVHHRREFIQRTDRGVFSVRAQQTIDRAENVRSLPGEVTRIHASDANVLLDIRYGQEVERAAYDFVIVAIGFNSLSFGDLFDDETRRHVTSTLGGWDARRLQELITHDLSSGHLRPRLHLPMLAGLAQGPGFPNLSCLGLVSDRILAPYVTPPARPRAIPAAQRIGAS